MLLRLGLVVVGAVALLLVRSARAEQAPEKAIVFVPPRDLEAPLHDALTAQLSGIDVELVVEHFVSAKETLKSHVEEARSLGAAHQAIGVFWLDTRPENEWLLFLSVPGENRVLMRRVPFGPEGAGAAVEAIAVIARETTSALLSGQKLGMAEVVVPDEPLVPKTVPEQPPKPRPAPAKPRPFRRLEGLSLGAAYTGDRFAKDSGWQSGVGLSTAWTTRHGFRFGATFVFFEEVASEGGGFALLVRRLPFAAEAGYSYSRNRWLFTASVRAIAEVVSRHVVSAPPPAQATSDDTRAVVFLSPRPRFDYRVTEALSVYLSGGIDFALNGFSFVNRVDGVDRAVFEPLRVRPVGELGIAFWP